MQQGKPYHWRDWSIIRGRDCLYIWSDAAALELSNGSNGWFRFILDGKLATMYSSGSPEGGSDSSGNTLFLLKCFTNAYNFDNLIFCSYFCYHCQRNSTCLEGHMAIFFNINRKIVVPWKHFINAFLLYETSNNTVSTFNLCSLLGKADFCHVMMNCT